MKKFLLFILVAIGILNSPSLSKAEGFSDIENHWAEAEIVDSNLNGLVAGYPDGTFKPEGNLTKAEFLAIFNRFLMVPEVDESSMDLDDSWYGQDYLKAITKGYLGSNEEIIFSDYITREEVAYYIYNNYKFDLVEENSLKFSDKDKIIHKKEVANLVKIEVLKGYPDGTFKPKDKITRAEICKVFLQLRHKLFSIKERKVEDKDLMEYKGEFAILNKDFVIDKYYEITVNDKGEKIYVESYLPYKLNRNDVIIVYKEEGGKYRFVPFLADPPVCHGIISKDLLVFDIDAIKKQANQAYFPEGQGYDKPNGKLIDEPSGSGDILERQGDWILVERPAGAGEAWYKLGDLKFGEYSLVKDLK